MNHALLILQCNRTLFRPSGAGMSFPEDNGGSLLAGREHGCPTARTLKGSVVLAPRTPARFVLALLSQLEDLQQRK